MIYFIQSCSADKLIKIGVSRAPLMRFCTLATASPVDLKLLRVTYGGLSEETRLHKEFAAEWVRGEWFSPSQRLLEYISNAAQVADVATPDTPGKPMRHLLSPGFRPTDPAKVKADRAVEKAAQKAAQKKRVAALRKELDRRKRALELDLMKMKAEAREAPLRARARILELTMVKKQRELDALVQKYEPAPFVPLPEHVISERLSELHRQMIHFQMLGRG